MFKYDPILKPSKNGGADSASTPYVTEELPLIDAIHNISHAWSAIITEKNINPSLLPGWLKSVCDAFQVSTNTKVLVIYENRNIVGVIPYYIVKKRISGISTKAIELATNLVAYHQELITLLPIEETIAIFISHLNKTTGWDILTIKDVATEGATYKGLTGNIHSTTYTSESSPYLTLTGSWEALVSSKQKKFRYKVNKREKELLNNSTLENIWFTGGDNCDELINSILLIEKNSWKIQDGMDITSRPVETAYYRQLIPYLSQNRILLANLLKLDGVAIAYNLCYQMNGRVGQIKTSFDNSYQELSPGAMIIEEMLRYCYRHGFLEFDFLGDVMPHKMAWTKEIRPHETVTLYNFHSKGYLIYFFAQLRKMAKTLISAIKSKTDTKPTI